MRNKQTIGIVSFSSLIIGFVFLFLFIASGKYFAMLPVGLTFLALSFVLSLFSRKNQFGKIALYAFPLLLLIGLLFFGFLYKFWDSP